MSYPQSMCPARSEVYLQLALDSNDSANAKATSGQTIIDYTAALAKSDLVGALPGDVVEFYGLAYGDAIFRNRSLHR